MTIGSIRGLISAAIWGALLSAAEPGVAQEKIAPLNGTADYKNPTVMHVIAYDKATQTKRMDSAIVKDRHFSFSIPFNGLAASVMIIASHDGKAITQQDASDVKSLLLDETGATVHIKGQLKDAEVTNDRIEEEKNRYIRYTYLATADSAKLGHYINSVSPIIVDYVVDNIPDSSNKEAFENYQKVLKFRATMKGFVQQKIALERKYVEENPDSYFCLSALEDNIRYGNLDDIMPLFNRMSDRLKNSQEAKSVLALLEKTKEEKLNPGLKEDKTKVIVDRSRPLGVGEMAPDFSLPDMNGKQVKLTDFKGKYILLDFWASWCVPCRKESPNLIRAYQRFKDKNFTIISVALEEKGKREPWLSAIKQDGLRWTQLVDYENAVAAKLYKVSAIPYSLLIDPSGRIVAVNLRGEALQDKLAEFLSGF